MVNVTNICEYNNCISIFLVAFQTSVADTLSVVWHISWLEYQHLRINLY